MIYVVASLDEIYYGLVVHIPPPGRLIYCNFMKQIQSKHPQWYQGNPCKYSSNSDLNSSVDSDAIQLWKLMGANV